MRVLRDDDGESRHRTAAAGAADLPALVAEASAASSIRAGLGWVDARDGPPGHRPHPLPDRPGRPDQRPQARAGQHGRGHRGRGA